MRWPLAAALALSLTSALELRRGWISGGAHLPTFSRDSVERLPEVPDQGAPFSMRLPLRDAVEAPPDVDEQNRLLREVAGDLPESGKSRVPLRDAVEYRVAPTFDGLDFDSIWMEQLAAPAVRRKQEPPNVICHLEAGATYRTEPFSLQPQGVPSHRCSHLIYSAATLDPHDLTVEPRDSEYDLVRGGYKAAVGLRQKDPALRVMISIGSPDRGRLFRELVQCPDCRRRFLASTLDFLKRHDFDGVEIDWEGASTSMLKTLLGDIYEPLAQKGYLVTVAIRPEDSVDPEVASMADLLLLRAWRSGNENLALHPAPLDFVSDLVKKWTDAGVEARKLILGVPLFGRSYTLKFGNATRAGSPTSGPGLEGPYTKRRGALAYFEICEMSESLWLLGRDDEGMYLLLGDQWIGYDDPLLIRIKMAYLRSAGLGGVSLFSLDLDDFQGLCGKPWPILNAATKALGIYDSSPGKCKGEGRFADPDNCSGFISCEKGKLYFGNCGLGRFFKVSRGRCVKADPEICKPGHAARTPSGNDTSLVMVKPHPEHLELQTSGPRLVCYLTSWSLYRKGEGKFVPEHLDPRLCTDVVYAFSGLNPETLLMQSFDPWADIENNLYQRVSNIRGPRVLLALGGWTDSSGDKYSRLVGSASSRRKFIAATIGFLRRHNFDGLSVEWNYPRCWQSDCRKGPSSDKANFARFIQELKNEFVEQEPKLILAVALSGYKEVIDAAYDVRRLSEAADFLSVMTYDYHGAWEPTTGHLSPLYATTSDRNPFYNVNFTMEYLVQLGAERGKLITRVPMYGQAYRLSDPARAEIGDPAAGPGIPGEFTKQPGMLAYYEICDRIQKHQWQPGPGPSAHHGDQWVGFEDPKSMLKKAEFILRNGYGGAAAWTVDLDDFTNRCCLESFPLLRSLNRGLGRLLSRLPSGGDCQRPEEPATPSPPTLTTHSDANDGVPRPTSPLGGSSSTTVSTTWPTWTERPTKTPDHVHPPGKPDHVHPVHTTEHVHPSTSTTLRTTTTSGTTSSWTTKWPWTTTTRRPPSDWETSPSPGGPQPGAPCHLGQYQADPTNCANYYRCVLGELKKEQCAPGLHWDASRGICDWPSAANCRRQIENSSPASWERPPTTYRPPPRPQPEQDLSSSESSCEHGTYYSLPESCTTFLVCVNGDLVARECGPGLNWVRERNICDWAHENPCKEGPRPTRGTSLSIRDKVEECTSGSYSEVPGDCGRYQACLWGKPHEFQCAPGLHFDKENRICDWPSRAKCGGGGNEVPGNPDPWDEVSIASPESPGSTSTTSAPWSEVTTQRPASSTRTPRPTSTLDPWNEVTTQKPLPKPEIDPAKVSPLSGHFKVVCYFTNWAWYRKGVGRYLPENIDHTLCTHIIYGFAVLDYSELTIKAHDSWADYDNRFYDRVVAYKKRGLRVILALGGWNDSAGDKYSRLVNSPSARKRFVENVVQFLEKFGFEGLDLDWEYPVCWQVDCGKGPASDKEGFAALLKELHEVFRPRGLLLSSAVSPSKRVIDAGYDVPALAKYLDWISVMTYDFHGQWDKKTGHVAPLYYHPEDEFYYFNANYSINYWISKGAPPRNIVMGMPLYGQSFSVHDPKAGTGLGAPASAGNAGEFTRAAGFLAYYEICERILNRGWKVVQDPQRRMGPYAFKGNQWVSFDDSDMIRQKAQYVRDMGLGGGMVWALDLDDFRDRCGEGPHPLMRTLVQVLADPPNRHDRPIEPPAVGQELEWKVSTRPGETMAPLQEAEPSIPPEDDVGFKVVCYFTNWAWYRQNGGRYLPEDIDPDLCTHVVYGFAVLDVTGLTIKSHDPWADIDNKFYERVVALKAKGVKVSLAIGGWNDSAGDKYSRLVNSPEARRRFVTQVLQFIQKYGFQGLDLDWEYPVCWQVDCEKGPASDKESFGMLVKELSAEFRPRGLLLSSAVSPSKRVIDAGYDVALLSEYLDWIAVMTYDFHGQWDKKTGHVAPLYEFPGDWEPTFNANFSIHYWLEQGASPKKLVMGAPLYGQSFSLAERSETGLNSPTYGGGEAGESTRARGFLSYYEICERTLTQGWTVVQDPERRMGPYAYKGDQWVSFDDAEQTKRKAQFIKDLGLGGGMVWALDLDDFKNRCGCESSPLLKTMNRVLRNYPDGPVCPISDSPVETPSYPTSSPATTQATAEVEEVLTTTYPTYPTQQTSEPSAISTTEDSVEVEAGPPLDFSMDCEGRMFVPHKTDCSKYILCNFGQVSVHSCPSGLYWNDDRCDWPENSKCRKRQQQAAAENPLNLAAIQQHREILEEVSAIPKSRKLVCYFTNWAWYRPGDGQFFPEDIASSRCTHVVYGFAVLDAEELTMKSHNVWADIGKDFYGRVTALKSKGVKVSIGLGGWHDSAGDKYSRLVNDPAARKRFVARALRFVKKHDFDGLDLDWEYPVCWQMDCRKGPASDKESFASLVKDLKEAFQPWGLLLSAAVSPSKRVIDLGYDVPSLARHLDWIAVMTYDFHGHMERRTGHVAPLYYYPGDEFDHFNANFSMRYWIEKGAPPETLVMGIPFYGQSFTLADGGSRNIKAPASGPGRAGRFTRAAGFLAFYEICENVKNEGWSVTKDPEKRVGPYAYKGDQWVSYDDVTNVIEKANLIIDLNLGGGMVWALDLDDFKNLCQCGRYPLLRTLSERLQGREVLAKDCT
ncbi:probable chitinase 10 [Orussus abietinus]|uniref:probable chitinase 10 n=1 Tax=Orussus abietinus TaxID=222816 RepID=UPI000C716173|nr:probable chitinase 10 [Orussus abietinus]XP_023290070.1 probable chitinase 10 [Orussus abietinus]XP_023290071.1 probable chitinase 10 [Orussus abietinus]XP_023290072.1 probable chitinase 10 [Orussus abietinus]XP_023290073.1 probable chitinase 10 [Orussus abietinus]